MTQAMRQAAEETPLITDPPIFDLSVALQLGYVHAAEEDLMAAAAIGMHYRPFFNLEVDYGFAIEYLEALSASDSRNPVVIMQTLGASAIATLSEEEKLNIGFKLGFTYMNALGQGIEHYIGGTAEIELGNYSPRLYLAYSYLNDLGGRSSHQATLGLRILLEVPLQ